MPISTLNVSLLCDRSSLIITGKTGIFRNIGRAELSTMSGVIDVAMVESPVEVVAVLKGGPVAAAIRVRTPLLQPSSGSIGLDGIPANSMRLLFLKRSSVDDAYEVVDPYHPSLPATLSSTDLSLPLLTQVASVECAVIINKQAAMDERLIAIWSLRKVSAPCVVAALHNAADGAGRTDLQLTAEAELLMRNDISKIDTVIRQITLDRSSIPEYLRHNLVVALRDGVKNPAAEPALKKLLKDPDQEVRIAAVNALGNIGTPIIVPTLISSLSDNSEEVRYAAAVALADIYQMPQMHASIPEFKENESKYTSYWRSNKVLPKQ